MKKKKKIQTYIGMTNSNKSRVLKGDYMEFTIKEVPFSWNDNFSEIALEDFSMIQKKLPYGICQSIGMALAKLELLEKQGCKVEEIEDGSE